MTAVPAFFMQPLIFPSTGSHFHPGDWKLHFLSLFLLGSLFHILILSFNTDIYSVSLKACMRYIPVFPYIEEHVESLPRFCCWALNLLNEPPAKASLLTLLDLFSMLFFKYQIHTVPALFFLILSFRYSGSWSYKHMIGTFTILAKMSWALCLKRQLEWGIISFGNSWVSIYQCGAFFPPVCSCENSKSSKGYFGLWQLTTQNTRFKASL